MAFYFTFIGSILKNRLINIRDRIELVFEFIKTNNIFEEKDFEKFRNIYFEYQAIRNLIIKSNSFWNYIFSSIYLALVPTLGYAIYNLFYLIEVEVEENIDYYVLGFTWAIAIHCFIVISLFSRPAIQIYRLVN